MRDARHAPSPAKLKRARSTGDVPQSTQLVAAVQMALAIATALWLVPVLADGLVGWTRQWWLDSARSGSGTQAVASNVWSGLAGLAFSCGLAIAGMLTVAFLAIWISGLVQSGWKPVRRSMSNAPLFRPMETLKSFCSVNRIWNVAGQAAGFLAIALVLCCLFYGRLNMLWQIDTSEPGSFSMGLFGVVCTFGGSVVALLVLGGLLDWYMQRRFWYRRQMMTDQEMREEARQDASPRHRNGKMIAGGSALDGVKGINTGS